MPELVQYLLLIPAVLISLTVHECAHAFTADKLGDPTARSCGRLSLNPLRHLDPLGAIAMILFRMGWAKPVPVNARNFRRPRRDMALTAAAGPVSNFLLSFFSGFLFLLLSLSTTKMRNGTSHISELIFLFLYYLALFFYLFHILNLSLGLFNLLPLTPLDGSRILGLFLPARAYFWLIRHDRDIYFATLAWLLLGSSAARFLMRIPAISGNPILSGIVSVLSLSGWISNAAYFLSDAILRFWSLIPFLA